MQSIPSKILIDLLEFIDKPIILCDENFTIKFCNKIACQILNLNQSEIFEKNIFQSFFDLKDENYYSFLEKNIYNRLISRHYRT